MYSVVRVVPYLSLKTIENFKPSAPKVVMDAFRKVVDYKVGCKENIFPGCLLDKLEPLCA